MKFRMDLNVGDKVKYNFPTPLYSQKSKFTGTVEIITDSYIYLRNEEGIRLRISFKNFDLLEVIETDNELVKASENFFRIA